jgi:hypothetical protein
MVDIAGSIYLDLVRQPDDISCGAGGWLMSLPLKANANATYIVRNHTPEISP